MIRCHLCTLIGQHKLRIAEVVMRTGLNRSTITALYNETATPIDLPAIEQLCRLLDCHVANGISESQEREPIARGCSSG